MKNKVKRLSQIGEFGLIERIKTKFADSNNNISIGIGDDACLIKPTVKKDILVTTDILLEGIHFDLSYTSFYQLGYKGLSVNISDIAAMGGLPRYLLISIGIPSNIETKDIDELYEGIYELTKDADIYIVGGDTVRSKGSLFLSLTLIGEIEHNRAISRSGAKTGDKIFVTGRTGDSRAGLEILQGKAAMRRSWSKSLVGRHLCPVPRLLEGRMLASERLASSMIDISDGLIADLNQICKESNTGALIYLDRLPVSKELYEYTKETGGNPIEYALNGGEDYELLFTVDKEKEEGINRMMMKKRIMDCCCIGEIVPVNREIMAIDKHGVIKRIKKQGYEHFKMEDRK